MKDNFIPKKRLLSLCLVLFTI